MARRAKPSASIRLTRWRMSARWHTRHRDSITGAGPPPFPFVKLGASRPLTDGDWTIYPDATGTRFINDRTGHGMFVSIENVYSF